MKAPEFIKRQINDETIKHILESSGARNIALNGDAYRSTCPLHGGDNPTAFVWNTQNGLWFCHTGDCGGGDIFDFVAQLNDLSIDHEFKDIVKKTAEMLGIDISTMDIGERASQWARETRDWLDFISRKQRAVNPEYDLSKLGTMFRLNEYRGFDADTLKKFDVRYSKELNRIVVPIQNEDGQIVGATCRAVDGTIPKWIHRPKSLKTSELLYNLHNVVSTTGGQCSIIVVEGVIDVWKHRTHDIVATYGAHLADEQIDLLMKYFVAVCLMYDNDKAGHQATIKAIEKLKNKTNLYVFDWSGMTEKDPGELESIDMERFIKHHEWTRRNYAHR